MRGHQRVLKALAAAVLLFSAASFWSGGRTPAAAGTVPPLNVTGTSNIFFAPNFPPHSLADGRTPPSVPVTGGSVITLTVTGTVSCDAQSARVGPDGGLCDGAGTNLGPGLGNSGIVDSGAAMFLAGVFTNGVGNNPQAPPPRLDFSPAALTHNFSQLSPQMYQTFFIGDGHTDAGVVQQFVAPPGATELSLGFADPTRDWGDNPGGFTVDASIVPPPLNVHATVLMGTPNGPLIGSDQNGLVPIATFTDPAGSTTPSDFSATIDWGDGTISSYAGAPNIAYDPNSGDCSYLGQPPSSGSCFQVLADHVYTRAETHGPYRYGVTVEHLGLGYADVGLAEVVTATTLTPVTTHTALAPVGIVSADVTNGGQHHVVDCTATVVDSPVGNVIVTARHCGLANADLIEFAPGHHGNVCGGRMVSRCPANPFGVWATTDISHAVHQIDMSVDPEPSLGGIGAYDYTFITLAPQAAPGRFSGSNVESVVGALPLAFMYNGGVQGQTWTILAYGGGYSSKIGTNGNLIICPAPGLTPKTITGPPLDPRYQVNVQGGPCFFSPLTEGSSGAPWLNSRNGLPNALGAICACGNPDVGYVGTILGRPAAQLLIRASFEQVKP